jgi:hypothetical protein
VGEGSSTAGQSGTAVAILSEQESVSSVGRSIAREQGVIDGGIDELSSAGAREGFNGVTDGRPLRWWLRASQIESESCCFSSIERAKLKERGAIATFAYAIIDGMGVV